MLMAFAASTSRWRWWLRTEPAKVKPTFGRCGFLIKIQPEKPNVVVFFVGSPRKLVAGGARNMSHVLAGGNRIMNNETILYSSAASFWGGEPLRVVQNPICSPDQAVLPKSASCLPSLDEETLQDHGASQIPHKAEFRR